MLRFRRESLKSRNTFGIDATAHMFADVVLESALQQWCIDRAARGDRQQALIIGGGSNLLITREVIDEPVLHIAMRGIRMLEDTGDTVLVEAMAGEPWHEFVLWSLDQGFCGLENLALIPGYVGAAPVQNIGAYGVEIKEVCESVVAIDMRDGSRRMFSKDACRFAYRDSVFKHVDANNPRDRYVITRVCFRLSRRFTPHLSYGDIQSELATKNIAMNTLTARDVANAVIAIRLHKLPDPKVIGNAGSFFKNPIVPKKQADDLAARFPDMRAYSMGDKSKLAAGWLIEKNGWKAKRNGASGVHASHALVIVNHGGATGAELNALAQSIRADVKNTFGIELEAEPRIV